jgi:hypothetical protein
MVSNYLLPGRLLMTDAQLLPAAYPSGGIDDPQQPPTEEEVVLGWECANPALQIERWCQELAAAAQQAC